MPWSVTDVDLKSGEQKVEVFVGRSACAEARCTECQAVSPRYDKRERRWRHLDTCQFQTVLVSEVPRLTCAEHGVKQIEVRWAEERSRFTAVFEMLVTDWLKEASVSAVCRQLDLGWDAVDGFTQRAVKGGLASRDDVGLYPDPNGDETAFRKRHDYVTVINDPGTGSVIQLCDGREKSSLAAFHEGLGDEQRAGIRTVLVGMWQAFFNATLESSPEAESKIAFDRFHLAQHLVKAAHKVRRDEHTKLERDGHTILNGTRND